MNKYEDGLPHGYWEESGEDEGILWVGSYNNGIEDGAWYRLEWGIKTVKAFYKNGLRQSSVDFNPNDVSYSDITLDIIHKENYE